MHRLIYSCPLHAFLWCYSKTINSLQSLSNLRNVFFYHFLSAPTRPTPPQPSSLTPPSPPQPMCETFLPQLRQTAQNKFGRGKLVICKWQENHGCRGKTGNRKKISDMKMTGESWV
jgi:hypothetical protein